MRDAELLRFPQKLDHQRLADALPAVFRQHRDVEDAALPGDRLHPAVADELPVRVGAEKPVVGGDEFVVERPLAPRVGKAELLDFGRLGEIPLLERRDDIVAHFSFHLK